MKTQHKKRFFNAITLPKYEFNISAPEFKREGEEFTIWFLEGILEKIPNYVDCLIYLGNAYTKMGMYKKGLRTDQKLSKLRQHDPLIFYNLACSYSLLNKIDDAFQALERAVSLGYNDILHMERDEDLTLLRKDERYKKLIENMKKKQTH